MNLTKNLLVVALSGLLFVSCKQSENAGENNTTTAEVAIKPETASFNIEGMTCEFGCAKTIQKELAGLDGVQDAKVDYETKTATVNFDATKLSAEKVVETVEAAADGKTYKVSNVKSSGDQAMVYNNDQEKEKKKKKNKKNKKGAKDCSAEMEGKKGGACCAAKKA